METFTYGSELVAARIATELCIELRYQLRMLEVHIKEPTIIYGDNQRELINAPNNTLQKNHNASPYYRALDQQE